MFIGVKGNPPQVVPVVTHSSLCLEKLGLNGTIVSAANATGCLQTWFKIDNDDNLRCNSDNSAYPFTMIELLQLGAPRMACDIQVRVRTLLWK